jgi:hypothetical protein
MQHRVLLQLTNETTNGTTPTPPIANGTTNGTTPTPPITNGTTNGTIPDPPPFQNGTTNGTTPPVVVTRPLYRVAVFGATSPEMLADVVQKLNSSNHFSSLTGFDATVVTPTASDLGQFDGVYVFSDRCFADPVRFGNALASYVSSIGGVMISGAAFAQPGSGANDFLYLALAAVDVRGF